MRLRYFIWILLLLVFPSPAHAVTTLALVNTCTAENHVGVANISCSLSATAGNVIVATGVAAGTNAACAMNPITGINAFNFDAGALYTNWHGSNKLSVEVYDSGFLAASSTLTVTLSGQCTMLFSSLVVYQFTGVTGVSAPASVNVCNAQPTGVTSLSCSLTALNGYGWIIGHGAADCVSCSFTNQANTVTQPSGSNFTDYVGIVKSVTPNVANSFTITNGASFNGGVSAIEITGNPQPATASQNLDNAVTGASGLLSILVTVAQIALIITVMGILGTVVLGSSFSLTPILVLGTGLLLIMIFAISILAVMGSFDPVFRAQGI